MWRRQDYIAPWVQQIIAYVFLFLQGAVFAFTKDHVASPYLVSLNLALLSVSYIDQWRKDFRREIRAEEEEEGQGP